jgi:hypothetical protein
VVQNLERWRRGEPPLTCEGASTDEYDAREAAKRYAWSLSRVRRDDDRDRPLTL